MAGFLLFRDRTLHRTAFDYSAKGLTLRASAKALFNPAPAPVVRVRSPYSEEPAYGGFHYSELSIIWQSKPSPTTARLSCRAYVPEWLVVFSSYALRAEKTNTDSKKTEILPEKTDPHDLPVLSGKEARHHSRAPLSVSARYYFPKLSIEPHQQPGLTMDEKKQGYPCSLGNAHW